MKLLITLVVCFITMNTTSAQNKTPDIRYKKYAGRYGHNSGLSLFEDGTYLLYGYATGVFGSYRFEKDYLLFSADKQDLFEVFAHHNPAVTDGIRINFKGFEDGNKTFVQFDRDSVKQVFNDNANCFDAPFVYLRTGKTISFILSALPIDPSQPNVLQNTSWSYENEADYNDFIFVYNVPKREYQDFSGLISPGPKGDILKLSNYGGDEGYQKQKSDAGEQKQWQEILDWKKDYDQSKGTSVNQVYANKHYHIFPEPDASKYHFEAAFNLYTDKSDQDNAAYYQQNQYNDPRYLRKYIRLQPETKKEFTKVNNNFAAKSIFFTVCGEGSEMSYHYDGFVKTEETNQQKLQTTEPVKIN